MTIEKIKEWIYTTDHKKVALVYLLGALIAFDIAGTAGVLLKLELWGVGATITDDGDKYNMWVHFHSVGMTMLFLIPVLTGFFGNYLIPLMIGARNVAYPRMNVTGMWLFFMGLILAIISIFMQRPPDIMLTGFPPYSTEITSGATALYVFIILALCSSWALGSINLICTIIFMRAPGMGWSQLNVFVWGCFGAFILQIIFAPVLMGAATMLLLDTYLHTTFFSPDRGGDAMLYQKMFWHYARPAMYIIVLPAITLTLDILATSARNPVFNYKVTVYLGVLGVVFFGSNLFGQSPSQSGDDQSSIIAMLVSAPLGLLLISMIGTIYKGSIEYTTSMLYASATIFMFLIGLLTGAPLAIPSTAQHLEDSFFVVGQSHFFLGVTALFAIIAGVYHWFPKISGKVCDARISSTGFVINLIGVVTTFWPMFGIGVAGLPRRYYDYEMFPHFQPILHLTAIGSVIMAVGLLITFASWVNGAVSGEETNKNPWGSKSLEWTHTSSPPSPQNFAEPVCVNENWSPYNYGKKTAKNI